MAGAWLKVEMCTPDKPEVIGIADMLGISPAHAFGSLFMVWRWFDQHTTEGNASFVTKVTIDRLSGNDGFADAMMKVRWLLVNVDGSVSLPHFDRHNGETAKQRGLTAKRVAKSKAKSNGNGNATVTDNTLPRLDKIREEVKPPIPPEGDFDIFWKHYPKKIGKGAAEKSWKKVVDPLATILEAIATQKTWPEWVKDGGQFIPNPATWLNQKRWLDGIDVQITTQFRKLNEQWEQHSQDHGWFPVHESEVPENLRGAP